MRYLLAALFLGLLLISSLPAQAGAVFIREHSPVSCMVVPAGGEGDVVPGARVWYGLRAYTKAYAAVAGPAIYIQIGGVSTYTTIDVLTNCNLDMPQALATAGVTGVASCTIATTTISCASGTGGLNQFGNIIGAGLAYPAYVTSTGCETPATYPCTATLNQSQTIGVAEPITGYAYINVAGWYDQSGANACSGSPCNLGPTSGRTNYLINKCQNTLPCVFVANSLNNSQYNPATGMTSTNTPLTYSLVASRTSNFTSFQAVISLYNATSGQGSALFNNTANHFGVYCSAVGTATAADSVVHAIQATAANASAAVLNIDGVETTGLNCGTGAASTVVTLFSDNMTDLYGQGFFMEAGMWPSNIGATDRGLLCHNQYGYWATGTSC